MTLVEAMIAMTVLAIGTLSALTTLTGSSALDDDLKERSVALRAAMSKMESIVAYDYNDQINNFLNYWSQPAQSKFDVDGLAPPVVGGVPGQHGAITIDATDTNRIRVTVTVNWVTRQGKARTFSLPRIITEVID